MATSNYDKYGVTCHKINKRKYSKHAGTKQQCQNIK